MCLRREPVCGTDNVPRVDEDGEQGELDEVCADPVEARSDEVGAGSEASPVARVPHRPGKWRRAVRRYYTWAVLLRRVFRVEIFTCPNCGGARRLLAAIKDPDSIELRQSAPRQAGRVGAAGDVPRATARAGCHSRRRSWRWRGLRRMVGVVGSGRD